MQLNMTVKMGTYFNVELQSMQGTAGQVWFLERLPEGVLAAGSETVTLQTRMGSSERQIFYFASLETAEETEAELLFGMRDSGNFKTLSDSAVVRIRLVPAEKEEAEGFVPYNVKCEECNVITPYGFIGTMAGAETAYGSAECK